jgi:transketolase
VYDVDGHDVPAMQATIAGLDSAGDQPHVLVADTTFGRGVGYMESQIAWHYWPMDDDQYAEALQDLEAAEGRA